MKQGKHQSQDAFFAIADHHQGYFTSQQTQSRGFARTNFHSMKKVFEKRNTYFFSQKLEPPPSEWQTQFHELAIECGLFHDMQMSFRQISEFYFEFINDN